MYRSAPTLREVSSAVSKLFRSEFGRPTALKLRQIACEARAYSAVSSFFDFLLVRLVLDLDSADFGGVARFGAVFFGAVCLALAGLAVTRAPDFLVAGADG